MLALERIELAPRVLAAALGALALVVLLEIGAFTLARQNPVERMNFGFSDSAAFAEKDGELRIRRSSFRAVWDQTYPVAKPAGVTRIVLVGDSVLRGGSYEESAAGQLKQRLAQCGVAAEVWNLSSPGYGAQRKHIMVRKALGYQPDLVVYHANVTTEYDDRSEWERRQRFASWHPGFWPDKLPLIGRITMSMNEQVFWKWLDREVRAGFDPHGADLEQAIRSKSDTEYWMPLMLEKFRGTLTMVDAAGVPLVVITRGDLIDGTATMNDYGLEAEVKQLAEGGGFAWLATREVFSKGDPRPNYADGRHWSPAGHQAMSGALLAQSLKILKKRCTAPARTPLRTS
jgi:hypothetical protein